MEGDAAFLGLRLRPREGATLYNNTVSERAQHSGACAVAHLLASYRKERAEQQTRSSDAEADPVHDGFDSAEEFRRYLDTRAAS